MEKDACVHAVAPASSRAQRELHDTKSGMECVKEDLKEMKKMLEFLVRRERKIDVKTEVGAKKLERLKEALADKTKVVKLVVDKWFVDRGFEFGKVPTVEIVFFHASVVRGGEVLMIGTDAWVQVVSDEARAEGVQRVRNALGTKRQEGGEGQEKANRVAQRVRRAAALTAGLAAQSEENVAVCDHLPGLRDEAAEHIAAPDMGAGGSRARRVSEADAAETRQVVSPLPASSPRTAPQVQDACRKRFALFPCHAATQKRQNERAGFAGSRLWCFSLRPRSAVCWLLSPQKKNETSNYRTISRKGIFSHCSFV